MVQTDEYLLDRIERIKEEMVKVHPEGGMQLEVWHQIGDGTHRTSLVLVYWSPGLTTLPLVFDFMDKMVWKKCVIAFPSLFHPPSFSLPLPPSLFLPPSLALFLSPPSSSSFLSLLPPSGADLPFLARYFHISNVIVRLSDGTPSSKANAILVNAHSDSTLPSPGAADDLVGVAVMLESLRVMALGERQLTNSVVFLFNGAEESLQDASHLFITQHPLKDTIRAAINLEAAGTDGKELVFQATSEEMIRALAHAPDPYATVIASEVFQTGIGGLFMSKSIQITPANLLGCFAVLSDTDFRQFEEYGNLTGLDTALVQNSYRFVRIPPLSLVFPFLHRFLTDHSPRKLPHPPGHGRRDPTRCRAAHGTQHSRPPRVLHLPQHDSRQLSPPHSKTPSRPSRLHGLLLHPRWQVLRRLHKAAGDVAVRRPCFHCRRRRYGQGRLREAEEGVLAWRCRSRRQRAELYHRRERRRVRDGCSARKGNELVRPRFSFPSADLTCALLSSAASLSHRFRNETFPIFLFGPPALLGLVLAQYFLVSNRVRSRLPTLSLDATESSLLEHASLVGLVVYYTSMLVLGHALGVGSSYLFAIGSVSALSALVVNDYVIYPGRKEGEKQVHLAAYVVGQVRRFRFFSRFRNAVSSQESSSLRRCLSFSASRVSSPSSTCSYPSCVFTCRHFLSLKNVLTQSLTDRSSRSRCSRRLYHCVAGRRCRRPLHSDGAFLSL